MQFHKIVQILICLINVYYVSCDMKKSWKTVDFLKDDTRHTSDTIQFQPKMKTVQQGVVMNNNNYRSTYVDKTQAAVASIERIDEDSAPEVVETVTEAQQKRIEEELQVNKIQSEIEQYFDKEFDLSPAEAEDEAAADDDETESNTVDAEDGDSVNGDSRNYNIGPGVDVSLNVPAETVNVTVNPRLIRDVIEARRGGKRYELITKIIPLLIVPFLIQSAIVPFMVSTIKLFILKSFFIGKIAVFLLLLGAFRNFNHNKMKSLAEPPIYMHPERRYESILSGLAGYQNDGRQAWAQ